MLAQLEFPIVNYEVCREKIREYVVAIGDTNPMHSDPSTARELGYKDIVAPPTFAACFATAPMRRAMADQEWLDRAGIDPKRGVIHGEQKFEFKRPITPGDRLIVRCIVEDVSLKKSGLVFLKVASRVDSERGDLVLEGQSTIVLRP